MNYPKITTITDTKNEAKKQLNLILQGK